MELNKNVADKVFCYAPWSNLEILPSGDILPCCKFTATEKFNIVQHSIQDFRNSQQLTKIKQDFTQGKWPSGCSRCQIEEASGIKSKRILDYERWSNYYDLYDLDSNQILTISMAFGNTCNLKCIICGPHASSKWQKEHFEIYNVKVDSINSIRKTVINGITNITPNLVHIDIHGGEPLLSSIEEHQTFLDYYINNNQSAKISLHYTTNGTIWPDQSWFDRWVHFKEVDLQISVDGVGSQFEYLRFPANWELLEKNVKKYIEYTKTQDNFRLSVAHAVSAYNIYYLDEFVNWCSDIGLPPPWMGKVHNPHNLKPTVWNKDARMFIINHLNTSKHLEVRKWAHHMNSIDNSELFDSFVKRTQVHDAYRKLNFSTTFPELAKFV
jgi:radical SAM protein with 4Fe4S-binding SPASM domain